MQVQEERGNSSALTFLSQPTQRTSLVTEHADTPNSPDPELSAHGRVCRSGGRRAHDAEDVIVAGKRRHVPRTGRWNVLTPGAGLAIDNPEDGRACAVDRRHVELSIAGVVP